MRQTIGRNSSPNINFGRIPNGPIGLWPPIARSGRRSTFTDSIYCFTIPWLSSTDQWTFGVLWDSSSHRQSVDFIVRIIMRSYELPNTAIRYHWSADVIGSRRKEGKNKNRYAPDSVNYSGSSGLGINSTVVGGGTTASISLTSFLQK